MIPSLYDVVVIGAGPAGLAAACSAYENGAQRVLVLERDREPGGILNQCIHNGFGLHHFKQELTGPEYAGLFIDRLSTLPVTLKLDTMVLELERIPDCAGSIPEFANNIRILAVNPTDGLLDIRAGAVILAMGCRERTRGAIGVPGDRPAGVFTAGAAQRYINIDGYMVGRRALILGSGDIGLIMARRMTLEGAEVVACVELMPYSNGLNRNIVQCLNDYNIPLYLSHTIVRINGRHRVESAVVAEVDENRCPIPGTERTFECDTILLSVGLIPENELSRAAGIEIDRRTNGLVVFDDMQTSVDGIFACGNVVHVHDLVDFVTAESIRAGRSAAIYAQKGRPDAQTISVKNGTGVTYTVPQKIRPDVAEKAVELFFRVNKPCLSGSIVVTDGPATLLRKKRVHMTPGEMEHLTIPKNLIAESVQSITVSVEPEE